MIAIQLDWRVPWVERRYLLLAFDLDPQADDKAVRLRCALARRWRYLRGA